MLYTGDDMGFLKKIDVNLLLNKLAKYGKKKKQNQASLQDKFDD